MTAQARRGDWMQTATGRQFWPLDPRPEEVDILDIAAHLSKICRYNGACDWHYSVAQHSVYVSHQVPPEHALAGLLHDATEAYCCDIHRPLKRNLIGYAEIEHGVWLAVAERFGLGVELPECVHVADNAVLLAEKAQIMRPAPAPWNVPGTAAPIRVSRWSVDQAREAFLSRYAVLIKARDLVLA
ncbi:hypothetical protein [Hydrogenophaga sp.]|uniref:hypothetical protein n=1 Tax=Hydrogenophaga sp. TaxID=1904254 RepID=UPI0025BE4791|nr:hypothetical protein [Hydrogenophaga sp.]MBT9467116.1 phosphohydrolase [Hydrogenophaga sp.]